MDYSNLIFFAIFFALAGRFVFGRSKFGSWTGSLLKGSIERSVGEIELSSSAIGTQTLKIYAMTPSDRSEHFVGLVIVSKAFMSASMQPYKLSKAQARELAAFLTQASA
jgi:hypothetical protein